MMLEAINVTSRSQSVPRSKAISLSATALIACLVVTGCGSGAEDKKDDETVKGVVKAPALKTIPPSPKYIEYKRARDQDYFTKLAEKPSEKNDVHPSGQSKVVTLPSGLQYVDIQKGFGITPKPRGAVWIHYTGWLENGTKFDSSLDKRIPFKFMYGENQVIIGLEEGIKDMKVGGVRKLIIPPNLAYGEKGQAGRIPPNATLIYKIRLLSAGKG